MRRAWLLLALVGCGAEGSPDLNDANPTNDGNAGCGITITFDPAMPVADPALPIRAYTNISNVSGVVTYAWTVRSPSFAPVTYTSQATDNSQINFIAPNPGPYYVTVDLGNSPIFCSHQDAVANVEAPNANTTVYRLRSVAASSLAPPQESLIQVKGGADVVRAIALDPGFSVLGTVKDNTNAGVQAYLKFMPVGTPNAFSELFTQASGSYSLRLLGVNHDVLVVPASTSLAPKLLPWGVTTTQLTVGPGTVVTGTVLAPGGSGLANAKVQLYAGVVPSTLATTAANGTFSLRADFPAATQITVRVTPAGTSGLPRLEATALYNLSQALQINYASTLATCDLLNTPVKRSGVNQANAKVFLVGASTGGTISTGTTSATATGTVRIATTTDGTGKLPSTLVPRATLTAVSELAMADHSLSTLDTTVGCTGLTIDAPPMVNVAGTTRNINATTIGGVRIEATPVGALALAGTLPVQATSSGAGAFNLLLAAGGRYDVRFTDPFARAAPLVALNVTSVGVPATATLPLALTISGDVSVLNSTNPVIGASIQVLCATCTGLDAARPVAETATDSLSQYRIAVPDPGTL